MRGMDAPSETPFAKCMQPSPPGAGCRRRLAGAT